MDDLDKNLTERDEQEQEDESASLKGMGWDILVGGEEHALNLGGEDPFDLEAATDEETEEIFVSSVEESSEPEPMRADAFWDRGRGAEVPEPPGVEESTEAPPRDLSPEDLGAIDLIVPSPGVSAEVIMPDAEPAEELEAEPVEVPSVPLAEFTSPPASIPGDEVIVTAPSAEVEPEPLLDPSVPPIESGVPFGDELAGEVPFASEVAEAPFGSTGIPDISEDITVSMPPLSELTSYPPPITSMSGGSVYPSASVLPTSFYKPSDPFLEEPAPVSKPSEPEMPPAEDLEKMLITNESIEKLWKEIDETYRLVISDVRGYFSTTELSICELKKAREYLLAGREYYDNAEELVKRVKARLRLEEKVRKWGQTQGTWLGIYLVVWVFLVLAMAVMSDRVTVTLSTLMPTWLAAAFMPGMFGSLGGVIGALWVLIKHIAKLRDFDPIHIPWYVTNPFMGFALGLITYLLVSAGGGLLGVEGALTTETVNAPGMYTIYFLCVAVGMNQNFLWSMFDRVVKAIVPSEETTATVEQTQPPAEG
ncbi:MAG: hypothetical protein JXJ17_04275 [Anaerolineae bacterium]|nr:hypothetical protein [Anaerolineae bacterium]